MEYYIKDDQDIKIIKSKVYNSVMDKKTGFFARWGKTQDEDPEFCEFGPEILDIEISTGGCQNSCAWCYKGNTNRAPTNMTLETFKSIIDKFPKTLGQVAIGITSIQTNPDFIGMLEYCRSLNIVPNFTLSGLDLTPEIAEKCSKLVGALAVSVYQTDKNVGYNAIKCFTDLGVKQTNMHLLIAEETIPFVYEVLEDIRSDPRLKNLNAVVFLTYKPKGRAHYTPPKLETYTGLVKYCLDRQMRFGFDSCGAGRFIKSLDSIDLTDDQKNQLLMCAESCESDLFSSYVNVKGEFWHCSFTENMPGQTPVNVLEAKDFLKDVWYSPSVVAFRKRLLGTVVDGCRHCPIFSELEV
jgi:MoaA/NifB/PqqE/SkfB family radical SAM enzyme